LGAAGKGEGFYVDDVFVKCKCPDDLALSPEVLPNAIANTAYSQTIVMSGGFPPYTYSQLPGSPTPPGLSLDPVTGVLSGIPTTPGIYEFSIVGTDANFCKLIVLYRLIVSPQGCPVITLTPEFPVNGNEGDFYSQVVVASGGTGSPLYLVTVGDLPPGLALDPDTGVISGTPTTPGIYQFTLSAVDANFCVGSADYTIIISPAGCPDIDIQPDVLPNAESGEFYSETLTATGGEAPYTWILAGGTLPGGLTLDPASGEISGAPFESAVFSILVAAQDDNGCFGSRSYGFEVIQTGSLSFFTLTPCRVLDTRNPAGPLGGPVLTAGVARTFIVADVCGIPAAAKAVSVNVTATGATSAGNLRLYPGGGAEPLVSTINYLLGSTRGNNAIVPVNVGQIVVLARPSGTVHVILDVNGYFQ
jgi:hypothetical protein